MTATVSQDFFSEISEIMNSGYEYELYGYLDRETGEVLIGSQGYPIDIEPSEDDDNYEAAMYEFEQRYLLIPQQGSANAYQDMVNFIDTVSDEKLRDLLSVAIQGRGAFGRFKHVLSRPEYESERNLWFSFSEQRENQRIVEWLAENNLNVG
ncbi:MAG: UPF0158 family protein [Cyanobacteria bacterium P01_G01_bin.19]